MRLDVADKISDAIDIVSKSQATKGFDYNHTNSFFIVSRSNVSEANSEHDGSTPVITPSILFIPGAILKVHFCDPAAGRVDLTHENEY